MFRFLCTRNIIKRSVYFYVVIPYCFIDLNFSDRLLLIYAISFFHLHFFLFYFLLSFLSFLSCFRPSFPPSPLSPSFLPFFFLSFLPFLLPSFMSFFLHPFLLGFRILRGREASQLILRLLNLSVNHHNPGHHRH